MDVDLHGALDGLTGKIASDDPYVRSIRVGQYKPGVVRLVLDVKVAAKPQLFSLNPGGAIRPPPGAGRLSGRSRRPADDAGDQCREEIAARCGKRRCRRHPPRPTPRCAMPHPPPWPARPSSPNTASRHPPSRVVAAPAKGAHGTRHAHAHHRHRRRARRRRSRRARQTWHAGKACHPGDRAQAEKTGG